MNSNPRAERSEPTGESRRSAFLLGILRLVFRTDEHCLSAQRELFRYVLNRLIHLPEDQRHLPLGQIGMTDGVKHIAKRVS